MRSYLPLIIAGCITFSAFSQNKLQQRQNVEGRRELIFQEGYSLGISSTNNNGNKSLEFTLSDTNKNFKVSFSDFGANGITPKDSLKFKYIFKNGEYLDFNASYLENQRIVMDANIYRDGKVISRYHEDTKEIGIPVIGPLLIQPFKVRPAVEKFIQNCDKGYSDFFTSIVMDKKPYIPYSELQQALIDAEKESTLHPGDEKTRKVLNAIKNSLQKSLSDSKVRSLAKN